MTPFVWGGPSRIRIRFRDLVAALWAILRGPLWRLFVFWALLSNGVCLIWACATPTSELGGFVPASMITLAFTVGAIVSLQELGRLSGRR